MERFVRVLMPAYAIWVSTERGVLGDSIRALSLLEKAFLIPYTAKHLPAQPHGVRHWAFRNRRICLYPCRVPWSPLYHP